MLTAKRFFCGTIFSAIIAWTIYLLTVDFYSIAILSLGHDRSIDFPFPGKWFSWYSLGIINIITLCVIACSAFLAQVKSMLYLFNANENIG